jgi:hypothetical protein
MSAVIDRRMTVELEGDFVVFLIGMRINAPLKVRQWAPVLAAMPKMVRELERDPGSGFLGARWLLEGPRLTDAHPVLAVLRAPGALLAQQ